jgi:hypothetical protein
VLICNSDPAVMQLSVRWLRCLTAKPLTCRIQYHADQNVDELCAFWGRTLDVSPALIRLQRKSNSSQLKGRTWRSTHGVLAASVNDTLLRARIQAWIEDWR